MATDTVGTLGVALDHAARLLAVDASAAEAQAREVLKAAPDHPQALRLLGAALRRQGDTEGAEAAYLRSVKGSVNDPELVKAAAALSDNRLA
ncbi:MAG TPA: tetratricopeptide repeat protein, partial [Phenylobacterium sp.]